jgi:hypothetical protein
MSRPELYALPQREREAVDDLELHLDFRARGKGGDHSAVDLDEHGRPVWPALVTAFPVASSRRLATYRVER